MKWAFRTDPGLKLPYQDNISALLHEPSFRRAAGEAVFAKARYINILRNRAVHEEKTISSGDANGAVKELFHVCFWLARTYAQKSKPADSLTFDASALSRRDEVLKKAFVQLKAQQAERAGLVALRQRFVRRRQNRWLQPGCSKSQICCGDRSITLVGRALCSRGHQFMLVFGFGG